MENRDRIIVQILKADNERRLAVKALKQELSELENQGEMCNVDRMMEIIDELNIIDPPLEDEEINGNTGQKTPPKVSRRRSILSFALKRIAVVCLIILTLNQVAYVTSVNFNIFDSIENLTKWAFSVIRGEEKEQDDMNRIGSYTERYKTIKELEKAEKIKVIVPTWLPNNAKIKNISTNKDYESTQLAITYDDNTGLIINLGIDVISYDETDDYQIYNINEIDFRVFKDLNSIVWVYQENSYRLNCNFNLIDTNQILKIIKSIK